MRSPHLLALWILGSGCAGRSIDARAARDELADALTAGDAERLAVATDVPADTLVPLLADARVELAERGEALDGAEMVETARIFSSGGGVVVLVREDEGWRVDRGLLGAPALATPGEALEAFARALSRVRGAHVTTVLSRRSRLLVADELERWLRGLADVSALPIVIEGDRASASLPTGVVIDLVLEAGEWRIEDVRE